MQKPKIKLTVVDRIGTCGCHRGHHIGDVLTSIRVEASLPNGSACCISLY